MARVVMIPHEPTLSDVLEGIRQLREDLRDHRFGVLDRPVLERLLDEMEQILAAWQHPDGE